MKKIIFYFILFVFASNNLIAGEVSLSFTTGFLGTQGNNSNSTTNNLTFSTLGIVRASFSQVDLNGDGKFGDGGTQGNDLAGTIRLYLSNGQIISLPGALNFRNNGNTRDIFGFIFDPGTDVSFTYGGSQTYTIKKGTTSNTSTSMGLRAYASTEVITSTFGGNASTSGLLDALNAELLNSPQPSNVTVTSGSVTEGNNLVYSVTLSSATTAGNPQVYTFTTAGTSSTSADYNGTFTFSNGVINNGDGTITVPPGVSSFTITISTVDDVNIEGSETLIINVGSKSVSGYIIDNDITADLTRSTITALPTSIVANGATTSTITVRLKDSLNADINMSLGTVVVTTTIGTLGTVIDNNNGTYTVTLTSNTAGVTTLGFSLNGVSATGTASVTFTADPTRSTITASPTSIVANGTTTSTIIVQLKDGNGTNLSTSGETVVVTTTSGTLGTIINNGNGTYTVTLTSSSTAGTATIGFSINGTTATNTTSVVFTPIGPDSDGDGILDANDLDDDNDGILDTVENAACSPSSAGCDTDGDGIINSLDLDSDNDGITDAKESNGTDANGDGRIDGSVDANGIPVTANGGLTPPDTDTDGSPNPYDLDSDNDGLFDAKEANGIDANNDGKVDGGIDANGIPTAANGGLTPPDTDGDGTPDYRDLDSDNDGLTDAEEKGPSTTPRDTDGDGTPDYRDLDSDNDGLTDSEEKGPSTTPRDTDGDGTPDYRDLDSDNDGLTDAEEKGPSTTPRDTDGDGTPDYRDLDSDNDGLTDAEEKGPSTTPLDTDGDGTPDYRDLDSDNDGTTDALEKGSGITPKDTDSDGTPDYRDLDADNDGIADSLDNCPLVANANQTDIDNDGLGDVCDDDDDNDGVLDTVDNCPITANANQSDIDRDGKGDVCDLIELNISQAITQNGDGVNDTWVIHNIENHPGTIVRVFNRWGKEVFYSNNYQNDWDGHYKDLQDGLPTTGAYMYQIDLNGDGNIDAQGWLYITN